MRWVLGAATLLLTGSAGRADLLWYNTTTNRITYWNEGTNFLKGSRTDNTVGCLVQLVWAGFDTTNNVASIFGEGTTGDDVVVGTNWIGRDVLGTDVNGWLNNGTPRPATSSYWYYVRAWSLPAASYSNGWVPNSGSVLYGDSFLLQYSGDGSPPQNTIFNFGGASGFAANLVPIPEPFSLFLFLWGLITFRAVRSRFKR
ncbi:MAG: hypothetical protein V2A34_11125 [Lentisphaerota bacterium]